MVWLLSIAYNPGTAPLSQCDDRILPTEDISLPNITSNDDDESDAVLKWKGFKIVGDNIDKNFRPFYQRMNSQTISLHFFHSVAVLDWVDFSGVWHSWTCQILA